MIAVKGALDTLTNAYNWEQLGSDTVDSVVAVASEMWQQMTDEGLYAMIGAIIPYATSGVPVNCLECDGSEYEKEDYPSLYESLHSAFIVDADTFRVPDLRGRTIMGIGQGAGLSSRSMNDSVGSETHTLTESQMPSHSHLYTPSPTLATTVPAAGFPFANASAIPASTGSAGSGASHNNIQPSLAIRYCIIAK